MGTETCDWDWTTADRQTPNICQLPAGHDGDHRSGPEGQCRACGACVQTRFYPGNRDEGRQACWRGYCDSCRSPESVTFMFGGDDYRTEAFPEEDAPEADLADDP